MNADDNPYLQGRPRGLSETQIESIRSSTVSNSNIEQFKGKTCSICLLDFVKRDRVRTLDCRHSFHKE